MSITQAQIVGTRVYPTRFAEIGFQKVNPDLWRFVSLEDGCHVGDHYRTKAELMANLEDYASLYSCEKANPFETRK